MTILVGVTFAMLVAWLVFTYQQYRSVTRLLGDQHAAGVEAVWRASSHMYRLSAGIMYREVSRHPAVIDWLDAANDADPEGLELIRRRFLSLFRPDYLRLRDEGFVQFQLRLADGTVLLRFHRPHVFGDGAGENRQSVRVAHEERRIVVAFEGGRSYPALRHVFPVEYERRLLGDIELSVPFYRLQEQFAALLPDSTFVLMVRRDSVDAMDPEMRTLYQPSPLHDDFLIASMELSDSAHAYLESVRGSEALARLSQASGFRDVMRWPERASVPISIGKSGIVASLIPVHAITGEVQGFVLAIRDAPELVAAQHRFLIQGVIGGSGIAMLGVVLGLLLVVARKRRQQELRARALSTQLTSLIEAIPDPVHFKDVHGRWLFVNQSGLRLCGLEGVEWQGKTDLELARLNTSNSDLFQQALERDEQAFQSGKLITYHDEVVIDGHRRVFEVRKLPLAEVGQPLAIVALRRDVTDERDAKARLVASERRYRDVVDNVHEVIFRIDDRGRLTFLNRAWEALTAWTVEASLGTQSLDYLHPDDRERSRALIRPLMKGGQDAFREEIRFRRADGGWRWVEVFAAPALDDQGRRCGAYGTLTDVSERRTMLDALRAERDLFAGGPVMVFIWRNEPGWPVEYVSANVIEALGYTPEEMTHSGFRFAQLIHPDDLPGVERAEGESRMAHRADYELSYRLRGRCGRYRWYREHSVPQWEDGGALSLIRGYLIDESSTREAQLAVEQGHQRLAWILEGANVGTWEWDIAGGEFTINERWANMLGYTVAELVPLHTQAWRAMMHPEDRRACQSRILAHFDGEAAYYEGEHRMQHKDGAWLWVLARGRVLSWSADGEPRLMCGTLIDIAKRKAAEADAAHLAYFDELTGLPNRRMLLERLRHAQAASKRARLFSALMFIDLDNFKNLNDTLGHDYGDLLLQEVAARLRGVVRESDTVARLGGDEFVVLFEELDGDEQTAAVKAERAVSKILSTLSMAYQLYSHRHHLSSSIGVTLFADADESAETLMKKVDLAMYQAKAAGRGTFRFFDPDMQATAERRMQLEVELRRGLEEEQFVLAYQPIVEADGSIVALEALLRWRHPEQGVVSPAEFIPVAEASGLIVPLGTWVLERACAQLAAWQDCPTRRRWRIAVNVSVRQFHQADFVDVVLATLRKAAVDANRLRLEITESMLLEHSEATIGKMAALRAEGVSFALDDFGTGYSSLNYLKKLPLSVLKIDQSFVRDISVDPNDAAIVQTIIAMAHALDLQVVAEGVETGEQEAFLLAHGCDCLQGYHFYRPMTIDLLDAVLDQANAKTPYPS